MQSGQEAFQVAQRHIRCGEIENFLQQHGGDALQVAASDRGQPDMGRPVPQGQQVFVSGIGMSEAFSLQQVFGQVFVKGRVEKHPHLATDFGCSFFTGVEKIVINGFHPFAMAFQFGHEGCFVREPAATSKKSQFMAVAR